MTQLRDTAIWQATKGQKMNLEAADAKLNIAGVKTITNQAGKTKSPLSFGRRSHQPIYSGARV